MTQQQQNDVNEIVALENARRVEWESKTIAVMLEGQGYTIADLRKTFDAVCNSKDWKLPFAAFVPRQIVGVVIAAGEFFHGVKPVASGVQPLTGKVLVESSGYAG